MKTASWMALCFAAFIIGACVVRDSTPAWAGETDGGRAVLAVTTTIDNNREVVWLIDTEKRMMAMYDANRGASIRLVAIRNYEWDMSPKILDFPKDTPSPTAAEMKKQFEEKKPEEGQGVGKGD